MRVRALAAGAHPGAPLVAAVAALVPAAGALAAVTGSAGVAAIKPPVALDGIVGGYHANAVAAGALHHRNTDHHGSSLGGNIREASLLALKVISSGELSQ